ncbi:MAG: hypothetical protein ACI4SM_01745 [Candidatus Gastranaerophilaceae bacterium]
MTVNFGMVNPYMNSMNIMDAPLMNASTAMGMNPFGMDYSMGMGYGYGMGAWNPQYQMNVMQQWDNFGINRQVQTYQNQNNAQFKMASQTEAISRQINILQNQIKADNQDNVKKEYDKLLVAVNNSYGSQMQTGLTAEEKDAQIRAYAERLYTQQTGTYITDDIREHSSNSFVSGLKRVLTLGLGSKTTADENIAKIEGTDLTRKTKSQKLAGEIVGALLGGVGTLAAFFITKGFIK